MSNELKVILHNGKLVTDSREVSDMINKRHDHLIRDIEKYVNILKDAPDLGSHHFFIKSSYINSQNKKMPCYLLTKKGCDMVANKMTGEKGVLFTAEYVTRFEHMEQEIQKPKVLSEKEQLMASMKLSIEANETLDKHNERISDLEATMRIDSHEEFQLKTKASQKIVTLLGGKDSQAYKALSRKMFSCFWKDFKDHFTIPRYGDLPKKKFEQGIDFVEMWQPKASLLLEMHEENIASPWPQGMG